MVKILADMLTIADILLAYCWRMFQSWRRGIGCGTKVRFGQDTWLTLKNRISSVWADMQPPPHARTWEGRDEDSYLKYTLGFKCLVLVGVEWGGLGGGGGGHRSLTPCPRENRVSPPPLVQPDTLLIIFRVYCFFHQARDFRNRVS